MKRNHINIFGALLCVCLALFSGCSRAKSGRKITSFAALNRSGMVIGSMTGTAAMREAQNRFPQAEFREYAMPVDAFTALCTGRIDAVVLDRPTLEYMTLAHPELKVLPEDLATGHVSVAAAKRNPALLSQTDRFIRECRKNGTLPQMTDRWFHSKEPEMPDIPQPETPAGILKIGITANNEPLCFLKNGKLAGYDVEFSLRLAADLGKVVEFKDYPYDALVPALESGKIDLAVAYMDVMPERAESVSFSENYVDSPIAVLVRCGSDEISLDRDAGEGVLSSFAESFFKTFFREERWKLILGGFGTTLLITLSSVIFGTLLAFPLCMLSRSRCRFAARTADAVLSLIMGTPVLIILMILYYVVFAAVDLSAILVAILAFSLEFAAYTAVTLRAGIDGVPPGQRDAALALGHTPAAAFLRFVLPQAVFAVLPVYRGTVISTLKSTAIVGFIAVMDLTKAGDVIRSRTYEPFFPLIAIALLYFLAAKWLTALLRLAERRLDPENRRKRRQKGGLL